MVEAAYLPTDRRPIRSRDRRVFQLLASWLSRRGASANAISIAGMAAAIAAGALFWSTGRWPAAARPAFFLAAALLQLRLVANLLDGMVAIASGKASRVGELYNEVPDRISDAAALIGAGYASGGSPALGFLAACTALFVAYVRAMGKAAGAASEFGGPMAKQQRMFVLTMAALWLALAPASWQPDWTFAGRPQGILAAALLVIIVLGIATAFRRLRRIARSLRARGPA